jgi:hypothetical protein
MAAIRCPPALIFSRLEFEYETRRCLFDGRTSWFVDVTGPKFRAQGFTTRRRRRCPGSTNDPLIFARKKTLAL